MRDKNLKYIARVITVVAFMGLVTFVIYYTGKTVFLWLSPLVSLYQPWTEMCPGRKEDDEE